MIYLRLENLTLNPQPHPTPPHHTTHHTTPSHTIPIALGRYHPLLRHTSPGWLRVLLRRIWGAAHVWPRKGYVLGRGER